MMTVIILTDVIRAHTVSVRVFEPEHKKEGELLPVMIYIHGGGFTLGSGKDQGMNHLATYIPYAWHSLHFD